jgi:pyruvate dehydrogenase E1 component alpha subunit
VCFFGDGTANIGAFHESLNLAAVWGSPIVFVCENNLYMEYTPIHRVTAVTHPAADRASSYGLPSIVVDGNDADEMFVTARNHIEAARRGAGPALIEAMTYRHYGHSRADPATYRPDDEVAAWLEKDPIPRYRERLLGSGIDAARLDAIDAEVRAAIDAAEAEVRAAPEPDPASVGTQVWSDGGSSWRN